jgi:hypothetical protein
MVGRLGIRIAGSRIRSSVSLNSKVCHSTTVVVFTIQISFQGPSIILILPTSQSFSTRFTRAFRTKTDYNPIHISPPLGPQFGQLNNLHLCNKISCYTTHGTQNLHPYSIQPSILRILCVHLIRLSPKYFSRFLIFRYLYFCPFLHCHFAIVSLCRYRQTHSSIIINK